MFLILLWLLVIPFIVDFSNIISKSDIKIIAEADETESVREIQVSFPFNFSVFDYQIVQKGFSFF